MTLRAWGLLILLSLIWGAAFTFSGAAVREVGFLSVVFLRVALAAVALAAYLAVQRALPAFSWQLVAAFVLMGMLNNAIPFSLLFWAQSPVEGTTAAKVSSGLASVFNATTPIFAMVIAHFTLANERLSILKLGGMVLGLSGVAVLFLGQSNAPQHPEESSLILSLMGMSACVLAAVSYGFGVVFGRSFRSLGLTPTQGALGQLLGSSLIMLPLVLIFDPPWAGPLPSLSTWGALLGLALLSTAVAYMIYFWLIANAGAVNATLVTLLIPASAIGLGIAFLGERFGGFDAVGLALIGLGLLVIDGRFISVLQPTAESKSVG